MLSYKFNIQRNWGSRRLINLDRITTHYNKAEARGNTCKTLNQISLKSLYVLTRNILECWVLPLLLLFRNSVWFVSPSYTPFNNSEWFKSMVGNLPTFKTPTRKDHRIMHHPIGSVEMSYNIQIYLNWVAFTTESFFVSFNNEKKKVFTNMKM